MAGKRPAPAGHFVIHVSQNSNPAQNDCFIFLEQRRTLYVSHLKLGAGRLADVISALEKKPYVVIDAKDSVTAFWGDTEWPNMNNSATGSAAWHPWSY
jgi:hypothetical protein